MKYEIEITKLERKTVTIVAQNPSDAIKSAMEAHRGFQASAATEVVATGEGKVWTVNTACESCDKTIFFGERSVMTSDDVELCGPCYDALKRMSE